MPCKLACGSLLIAFALQCSVLRAEMQYRSLERVDGQERWSQARSYTEETAGRASAGEEVRVLVTGAITREDAVSAAIMARLVESGRQRIAGNTVWFASNGGDIDAAMGVGMILRRLGVFSLVGKDDQCMSACVFAFMGGDRRIVAGRLGIHRPYFPTTQIDVDRPNRYRQLQKILRAYIEEMDFPPSLYEAIMAVPPQAMKFLAVAELKHYFLDGISPSAEDLADAASAKRLGLTMAEFLIYKAKVPDCPFHAPGQDRCDGRTPDALPRLGAASGPLHRSPAAASGAWGLVEE